MHNSLFSVQTIVPECRDILLNGIHHCLSDPDCAVCEGALSLAELTVSLKSINANKALPSSDSQLSSI